MSDEGTVKSYLAQHPKMMGVLFTMFLLLTQVGNVAAGGSAVTTGP